MYKSSIKACLSIVMLVLTMSQTAFASNDLSKKFYLGLGISNASMSLNEANATARYPGHDEIFTGESTVSLELLMGYKLDQYLSIEMGFSDLGTLTARDGALTSKLLDLNSIFFDVTLAAQVTERVSLFGKLGISMWTAQVNSFGDPVDEGTGMLYGAGFDLNLYGGDERQLRFEWKRHDYDNLFINHADTVSMTLMMFF